MKILLVADLHYTLRQWDWLGVAADRFDLVVVAGDLLDLGSIVPTEAQIIVVRKYLERLTAKAHVIASSGNHDILPVADSEERRADWLHEKPIDRLSVDGDWHEQDDYCFSILPWWDGPETRRATEEQLGEQAKQVGQRSWVWIYHPPPLGTATAWNGRKDLGDAALIDWIKKFKPYMILGGHIHPAPFYADGSWVDLVDTTWVFNSGRQTGGIPTFTIIDTDENKAMWISSDDAEQAFLNTPLKRGPIED